MQRQYRKIVLKLYRQFRHPRHLKKNRVKRWLARHFLDKTVWKPTRHTFGGGLAIGLFVMMLIIPGQTPLAILLAALLRVNIPIAVIITWIVNPVTVAPTAWVEIEMGNWLCQFFGIATPPSLGWDELKTMYNDSPDIWAFGSLLKPWAVSLYLGAIVSGTAFALAGYALAFLLWDWILLLTHRRGKE